MTALGSMRYKPAATPELAERWRKGHGHDWQRMPVIVLNEKDDLQHRVLARRGVEEPILWHRVPTAGDFAEAIRLGLGWGLLPESQLEPWLADGSVVLLGRDVVDVPLHWMRWRIDSRVLDRLGEAVTTGARAALRRPRAGADEGARKA